MTASSEQLLSKFKCLQGWLCECVINDMILTLFAVIRKPMPSGINAMPIANNNGKTVLAVNTGCHAGSFCCLNFVSETNSKP